jgi:hypothetical protein
MDSLFNLLDSKMGIESTPVQDSVIQHQISGISANPMNETQNESMDQFNLTAGSGTHPQSQFEPLEVPKSPTMHTQPEEDFEQLGESREIIEDKILRIRLQMVDLTISQQELSAKIETLALDTQTLSV